MYAQRFSCPIISEEFSTSNYNKEKLEDVNMSPQLGLETLGLGPTMPKNFLGTGWRVEGVMGSPSLKFEMTGKLPIILREPKAPCPH